jgi:hypothetical protein
MLAIKCVFTKCVLKTVHKKIHEIESLDATHDPSIDKAVDK